MLSCHKKSQRPHQPSKDEPVQPNTDGVPNIKLIFTFLHFHRLWFCFFYVTSITMLLDIFMIFHFYSSVKPLTQWRQNTIPNANPLSSTNILLNTTALPSIDLQSIFFSSMTPFSTISSLNQKTDHPLNHHPPTKHHSTTL